MKKLRETDLTVIVDSREQLPYDLSPFATVTGTLEQGDYAIKGIDFFIERKSLSDFVGCVGRERDRFKRELERLRGRGLVVIEASMSDLQRGQWRGRVTPNQAIGSLLSWQTTVPFCLAGNRDNARNVTYNTLRIIAQKKIMECSQFLRECK